MTLQFVKLVLNGRVSRDGRTVIRVRLVAVATTTLIALNFAFSPPTFAANSTAMGNLFVITGTVGSNFGSATTDVSCPAPGKCVAVGYEGSISAPQPFIATESKGIWGAAKVVLGLSTVARGAPTIMSTISCPVVGECSAGGLIGGQRTSETFTVDERGGSWGTPALVSGLPKSGNGAPSIECPGPHTCVAVSDPGLIPTAFGVGAPYLFDEVNGKWSAATPVPGLSKLRGYAGSNFNRVTSLSCSTQTYCVIVGGYQNNDLKVKGLHSAFIDTYTNGSWLRATTLPSSSKSNNTFSILNSVACDPNGDCVAGGIENTILKSGFTNKVFLLSESNGTWSPIFGLKGLSKTEDGTLIDSIYCQSAGSCNVVGYGANSHGSRAFLITERNSSWSKAIFTPPSFGNNTAVSYLACSSVKKCGTLSQASHMAYALINGRWAHAFPFPMSVTASGQKVLLRLGAITCRQVASCVAGGSVFYSSPHVQGGAALWTFKVKSH
jgi:hypothetical protein